MEGRSPRAVGNFSAQRRDSGATELIFHDVQYAGCAGGSRSVTHVPVTWIWTEDTPLCSDNQVRVPCRTAHGQRRWMIWCSGCTTSSATELLGRKVYWPTTDPSSIPHCAASKLPDKCLHEAFECVGLFDTGMESPIPRGSTAVSTLDRATRHGCLKTPHITRKYSNETQTKYCILSVRLPSLDWTEMSLDRSPILWGL
jgi:hypothetical protein